MLEHTLSEEGTLKERGYKLLKKLGEGSYAKVYLGEYHCGDDKKPIHKLACKVIDTTKAPYEFVRKFLPRELSTLIKLNHPHVIHVHSILQRRSKYFIFMRHAENGDLLEFLHEHGIVGENQARIWSKQLGLALQYLHNQNIAHRDLKCENILVTSNFNVKLSDFGFARFTFDERKKKTILCETYCGSLSYAPPEILKGIPYDAKMADMWSCGVIIYTMLNKALPFNQSNTLYHSQMHRRWKFRSRIVHHLSDNVKKLIANLLEPEINKRLNVMELVNCDWIFMDARLRTLNTEEENALKSTLHQPNTIDGPVLTTIPNDKTTKAKLTTVTHVLKDVNNEIVQMKSEFNKTE